MKKILMLVMLAFFFVTSSKAQCPTDVNACQTTRLNISTGINTGGPLMAGSNDPRWNITSVPVGSGIPTPSPAIVIGVNSGWNNTGFSNVRWLGPAANSHTTTPPTGGGTYVLTRTFCVCVAGSFNISGNMNADDNAQLAVNSTVILGFGPAFGWPTVDPFNTNITLGVGVHTITLTIQNPTSGPTGAVVDGNITSNGTGRLCCEPGIGIGGIKYNDVNNNGVVDGGDTPLPGWTFTLTGGGVTYTAVTNAAGQYNITGLFPANYTLSETIKPGWMAVTPAGGTTTVNYAAGDDLTRDFLNKIIPDARGCCDDINSPNKVINGSFEGGNVSFTTGDYIYQPVFTPNSVHEGRYSVLTGTQASAVSPCWDIPDHTSCTSEGRFLVYNGRTHNPASNTIYEQTNIQVTPNVEHIFCMYFRHLPQCAFDVFDANNMNAVVSESTLVEPEEDCIDEEDHCGWTKRTFSFIPMGSTVDLQIFLGEGGEGDGNDVAFDDLSIRKKGVTPPEYCNFGISTSTGSQKTITATAMALPAGFTAKWTVEELDCVTGSPIGGTEMTDPNWNPVSTNFPGYCCLIGGTTPGAFFSNKCYKITRRVTSCCYIPCEDYLWVSWQQPMMMSNDGETPTDNAGPQGNTCYISRDGVNWTKLEGTSAIPTDDISLFPNPGDGNLTIKSGHSLENTNVTVYSSDSKVVLKQHIDGAKGNINISKLPSGVYSLELIEPDGTRTFKKYVKQ